MKYYIIDAFAEELFKGNPAGVCLLEKEIPDEIMQKIAFENNLAETAFLLIKDNVYCLRWFTPEIEMDLCGHATLATGFVVMNYIEPKLSQISFETISGKISVTKDSDLYKMDLPSRMPIPIEIDKRLEAALGCTVIETHMSRDLLVIVKDEETVRNLNVDFKLLSDISNDVSFTLIVSAKGENCDFVSRFFVPNEDIHEDPVTGSAHSTLTPFWSERLGKDNMIGKQLSLRGGTLICENKGKRVSISGKAVCYLVGEIRL